MGVLWGAMVARSRLLWGDRVHGFYQVVGVILVLFGIGVAVGS